MGAEGGAVAGRLVDVRSAGRLAAVKRAAASRKLLDGSIE
jgi:hypothetical protein